MMNKFITIIFTLLLSTTVVAQESDDFKMTSVSTVDQYEEVQTGHKQLDIQQQYNEFTSTNFLSDIPGFDETHKFLEAILGDMANCAESLGEEGCEGDLNNLMHVYDLIKWLPLLCVPGLITYALLNLLFSTASSGSISARGYDYLYILRSVFAVGAIYSGLLFIAVPTAFYWSIQAANYVNYNLLDNFTTKNTDFDPVTVHSLSAGQKLTHMMICSSSLQEIKGKTPGLWEQLTDQEVSPDTVELATYFLVDKHGKHSTQKIYKHLWESPFHNPLNENIYIKRIEFGASGVCGQMQFEVPKETFVPEFHDAPVYELSGNQKAYYTALRAAQNSLFNEHLNKLAFDVGFFSWNTPAMNQYGISKKSTAGESIYNDPEAYIGYINDDWDVDNKEEDYEEKARLTIYHGSRLVNQTIYMLNDIENIMESAVAQSGIIDDMLNEAKHRGVTALAGYGSALVVSNKGVNNAYRDMFNSFEIMEPVKTCDSWYDNWFNDNTENCNRIVSATTAMETIYKTSLKKITALIETGKYEADEELLTSLRLSAYELKTINGGNSISSEGLTQASSDIMNVVLNNSRPIGDDYSPKYWVNPWVFTQELGSNLLWASFAITSVSLGMAGVAGAAQSVPVVGGAIHAVWQYIDGGAATLSALTYGLSFLMVYSTQIFFFIAMAMMIAHWIQRFLIGMWIIVIAPINLLLPGEGMMGYRMEKVVMMFVSLIGRPILDICMLYLTIAAIYVVNGIVIANFWHFVANAFTDKGLIASLMLMLSFCYIQYSIMVNMYQFIKAGADNVEELFVGTIFGRIQADNELMQKADGMVSQIGASGGVRGSSFQVKGLGNKENGAQLNDRKKDIQKRGDEESKSE